MTIVQKFKVTAAVGVVIALACLAVAGWAAYRGHPVWLVALNFLLAALNGGIAYANWRKAKEWKQYTEQWEVVGNQLQRHRE